MTCWRVTIGHALKRLVPLLLCPAFALSLAEEDVEKARATIANWDEPAIDRWLHQKMSTPGRKTELSLFTNFEPGAGFHPSRNGVLLMGFDVSDQIPRVTASRYQPHRVTVTATHIDVDDGPFIVYDPTMDMLAEIHDGSDDPGKPIELFGIGYDNDYTQLGWESNDAAPPEFEESSPLWDLSLPRVEQTFNIFPLGDDGFAVRRLREVFAMHAD